MSALLGTEQFRPATLAPARSRGGKPGLGPLADQSPFELRQGGKKMEGELAIDCRGIDPLGQGAKLDTTILQRPDQHDEVR